MMFTRTNIGCGCLRVYLVLVFNTPAIKVNTEERISDLGGMEPWILVTPVQKFDAKKNSINYIGEANTNCTSYVWGIKKNQSHA